MTSGTEKESYQYYSKQQVQNLEGEKLIKCSSSPLRSKEVSFIYMCVFLCSCETFYLVKIYCLVEQYILTKLVEGVHILYI